MKEVFTNQDMDAGLSKAGDYREVDRALNQLMPGSSSARFFMRTDEAYRPVYELLRQGKMPESETLLGRILNRLLAPPEEDEQRILREQKIDGRLLPDFEMVRRYFSPAGTIVRSNDNGWFIAGTSRFTTRSNGCLIGWAVASGVARLRNSSAARCGRGTTSSGGLKARTFPIPSFPQNWPKRGARSSKVEGRVPAKNILFAESASTQTTIWLSPDTVDFSKPVKVTLNGKRLSGSRTKIDPQLEVLLEDVRTRADRLHPFWAKLQVP